jgi:hypothetical protein
MSKVAILVVGRLFFGLLTLVAIGVQLGIHIQHGFAVLNFFSYFTNLSNIFAAVVFLLGALALLRRREPRSQVADDLARGAAAAAMAIVGIVYGILLRNEDLGTLLPWVNVVVHYVMPVAVVADWLYAPPASRLTLRQTGYWLIYPLLFLIYTLVRGAIVNWYPYPFLNPAKAGGYGGVTLYAIAIFVAFLIVGWLLVAVGNAQKRDRVLQPA